ncbi:hypothetical protein AVEN_198348-1, partial [Araneus ventricosus]
MVKVKTRIDPRKVNWTARQILYHTQMPLVHWNWLYD